MNSKWMPAILAGSMSAIVWSIAAAEGYAFQTIWLPGVVIAAAWPRRRHGTSLTACRARLRRTR